jgi:hypothetical protein
METWSWVVWAIGGVAVVGALLKIMLVRRNQVVIEWQAKAAAEKKQQKKK